MKCAIGINERKKLKRETTKQSVIFMLVAFATYLGDKRRWTPESIVRALQWIQKYAEMLGDNYTTFEESKQTIFEEYGILFQDDGQIYFESRRTKK